VLPENEIRQIREYLASDFEHRLFEASLRQAERRDDPLRASNFAYSLRELSRHVLKRLAPDQYIADAPWYEQALNERGDVVFTRHQRIKYAIQGQLEDSFLREILEIDYSVETRHLKHEIDNLSKYTHIEPGTFEIPEPETAELCAGVLTAFADMFRAMFDCREKTLDAVADLVNETVVGHVVEQTLEGFYDFAPNYALDEVLVEEVACTGFDQDAILGSVSGSVSVTLQYGSPSDRRKGDGMDADASASFSCDIRLLADDFENIEIVDGTFEMDYSEFEREWTSDGGEEF
jgi:hypothetical protein